MCKLRDTRINRLAFTGIFIRRESNTCERALTYSGVTTLNVTLTCLTFHLFSSASLVRQLRSIEDALNIVKLDVFLLLIIY